MDDSPREFGPFAVTADLVIFTVRPPMTEVLLIQRAEEPFRGEWALPGGFVAVDQSLIDAARFKLSDKTGIDVEAAHLEQLASFGEPERDPRMRVVSVAYLAMVAHPPEPRAGSDAMRAAWRSIDQLGGTDLVFDHNTILRAGVERAKAKLEYTTLATSFCGSEFTMGELRSVYETAWDTQLDPANFHRKVLASPGFVEPTGITISQPKGRPAKTYRRGRATDLRPPIQRS